MFAAAHEDDAFNRIVVIFCFVLKAKDAETRSVADFDVADVLDANGRAVIAGNDDFADVVGGFDEAEAAHIIKLAALGIKTAASIGVVGLQSVDNLHDGNMETVQTTRIEKNLVLHGRPAETGIIGDAGNAAVGALDDPVFEGVKFLRRAIGTFDHIAIDEAAGTE